jgi:enoyl-CoA hydratase/carnithine racemase
VPAGELMSTALRWAGEIVQCSPASIAATKAMINALDGQSIKAACSAMMELPEVKNLGASPDCREGPRAFAERRPPNWSNPA